MLKLSTSIILFTIFSIIMCREEFLTHELSFLELKPASSIKANFKSATRIYFRFF